MTETGTGNSSKRFRQELGDLHRFLKEFLRHPIQGIRQTPPLSWPALFSLQAGAAMVSGALLGVMSHSFIDFLLGLIIFPISSVILSFVFALFIYYFFSLFHSTFLEFRRLYGIIVLANLPYFIFHVASGFLPPIDLVGFAFASALLIVGLVEQFSLERKTVIRLIGALYLIFFLIWAVSLVRSSNQDSQHHRDLEPKSLDELEREM
jgi:multisubunit Na+/H+ antiporter MnhE subunit